ncbi:MAG: CPBP family intramembrane metalloprotease [Akkermansiaceae bacterium]|nr:CPBP family intramembrane metalloprotease [Akkermansiaceae bacterium]NNM30822.1 CPBP family intramembrane metalloprotease [Akkermansiaceae bacterium]
MTLLWLVVLMGVWMSVQVAFLLVFLAIEGGSMNPDRLPQRLEDIAMDGDFLGLATVLTAAVICPLCLLLGKIKRGFTGTGYLALGSPRLRPVLAWSVVVLVVGLLFNLAAPAMGVDETPEFMLDIVRSTDWPVFLLVGVVAGAPLLEEFIFRGLLFRGWRVSALGVWGTIIVTSLLWTLMHAAQYEFAILAHIFLLGILLGYARERTGNLWIPIAMHAANNAFASIESMRLAG